jgi:TRAP-type C4-dicarboxylate transport system permease small subunit
VNDFLTFVDRLAAAAAAVAALCLGTLAAIVLAEVAAVKLFGRSLEFTWEYAAFLMCAAFFLGAGWTLRQGGHVRVLLFSHHLSPTMTRVLDMVASALGLAIALFLTSALAKLAWSSFISGSRTFTATATPLVVPQGLAALGALIFSLALVARLLRLFRAEEPEERSETLAGEI